MTQKGKGYTPAEDDPCAFHGVSGQSSQGAKAQSYTQVFSAWINAKAAHDPLLNAITPAMREGSGLVEFSRRFADRYHDVAIAEQHALTLAGGMAIQGLKPVVAIYSTFLQRGYDQLIHDIALQNLDVLFAIDRAGVVGADGPTHGGNFDVSFLRCIPNMVITTPCSASETLALLDWAYTYPGPACVRYPRDIASDYQSNMPIQAGFGEQVRQGEKRAYLVFGPLLEAALELAEKTNASVYNMRFVKPLASDFMRELASRYTQLITLEDSALAGGAGSAVLERINDLALSVKLERHGLGDHFIEQGIRADLLHGELALD